jgi:endonuclease YncB( thermonuclease family)
MAAKTGTWLASCAAALALAHAAAGLAADGAPHKKKPHEKKWQTLDNCRYVERGGNDGDSFGVQCASRKFIVRLYFVDAPETQTGLNAERAREQMKYFGVAFEDLLGAGHRANELARNVLGGPFVVFTKRASAPGSSKEPRFYCLVQVGGRWLHETLVAEGLARVKGTTTALPDGTPSKAYLGRLRALENQAHAERRGVWGRSLR